MKKTLIALLLVLVVALFCCFVACEKEPTEPEKPVEEQKHDCAKDGHKYVSGTCSECGAKEPTPPYDCETSGHKYVDGTCSECGEKEPTPPYNCETSGHKYVDGTCSECGAKEPYNCETSGHKYVDGTCSECGEKEPLQVITIAQMRAESANNAKVKIEGTIVGIITGGFYVQDATGIIFVNAPAAATEAKIGDTVTIEGTYGNGKTIKPPQVKQAVVKTTGTTTVSLTATESSVEAIATADKDENSIYGTYVSVVGTIGNDSSNRLAIVDEKGNSILFNSASAIEELDAFNGKRVKINVIVHGNSNGAFTVSFVGKAADVQEKAIQVADVLAEIKAWVDPQIPAERTGSLTLPVEYELIPAIIFAWSIETNDVVTIQGNKAVVDLKNLTTEKSLKLTLTLTSAPTDSETIEYTIVFKPISERAIDDVIKNAADEETVMVTGVILTYINDGNDTAARHGYALIDNATGAIVYVSNGTAVGGTHGAYLATDATPYGVGDEVTVVGKYTIDTEKIGSSGPLQTGRHNIDLTDGTVVVKTAAKGYDYSKAVKVTVTNGEELAALAKTLPFGTIIKISGSSEAPLYVGCSASSFPANMKLIYVPGTANSDCQLEGPDGKKYVFSLKTSINELNAVTEWYKYNFGYEKAVVRPKDGNACLPVTGEAYVIVSNWTSTYYQLAFVDYAATCTYAPVTDAETAARYEIEKQFIGKTTIDATTAGGTITLPTTLKDGTSIAWTSNNETVVITEGVATYGRMATTTVVELTATYTIESQSYTTVISFTLEGATVVDSTVSEVATGTAEAIPSLVGTIATWGTVSGNGEAYYTGFMITDGVYVLYYKGSCSVSEGVMTIGGVNVKIGDQVRLTNVAYSSANGGRELSNGGIEVISSGNTIDWTNLHVDAEIINNDTMTAYAATIYGVGGMVVKFSGSFSFVGTGTGANCRYQINYKNAAASPDARYAYADYTDDSHGNRTFSFHSSAQGVLPTWYEAVGMPSGSSKKCWDATGSFYAVSCGSGATMHAWVILDAATFQVVGVTTETPAA